MILLYLIVATYAAIPAVLALAAMLAVYETFAEMKCPLLWFAGYFTAVAGVTILAHKVSASTLQVLAGP